MKQRMELTFRMPVVPIGSPAVFTIGVDVDGAVRCDPVVAQLAMAIGTRLRLTYGARIEHQRGPFEVPDHA